MNPEIYFKDLTALITLAVDEMAAAHPSFFYIFQDNKIIHECAGRTYVTLREYNMRGEGSSSDESGETTGPVSLPNYFKEAGHFAYWIARLKPLRLVNFHMVAETLGRLNINHDAEELARYREKTKRRHLVVYLNEYAALYVARSIIYGSEREMLRQMMIGKPEDEAAGMRDGFLGMQKRAKERTSGMVNYVLKSLRYDTQSPNSVALLLQSLMGSGYPFPDAEL